MTGRDLQRFNLAVIVCGLSSMPRSLPSTPLRAPSRRHTTSFFHPRATKTLFFPIWSSTICIHQIIRIFDSILSPKLAEFDADIKPLAGHIAQATLRVRTKLQWRGVSNISGCVSFAIIIEIIDCVSYSGVPGILLRVQYH